MGNAFFGTPFFGTKCSTKEIKMFLDLIPDLENCPNQVWALPKVRIKSESNFLIKCHIISVLKKCVAFRPKKWLSKNGFPIVFSKSYLGGGVFLAELFFSKKSKHPGICLSFSGNVSKT